jgi:chitinase
MRTRFLFTLALLSGLLTAVPLAAQDESATPYRLVGYYTSWAIYERAYFVTNIPAEKLTHLNYAFATVSDDGEVVMGDEWADAQFPYPGEVEGDGLLGNFHQLQLLKEQNPNLQTLIAIGGWLGSSEFSDVALTDESRQKFARSAVEFMLQYGFDGVDIDWEYPTGGGNPGNTERPEDRANFVLLLQELRSQLDAQGEQDGRVYPLTIALGASADAYAPLDWASIVPLLDWINIMTYDMSGGWSEVTGFNSPLYDSVNNPPEGTSVDSVVKDLLALGIPPEKLVVGVPFYGRGWSDVGASGNGLHQPYGSIPPGTWEEGVFDYRDLAANYMDVYQRFWHDTAQVPWLYNAEDGTMITYDDPESMVLKAAYVRANHLGGIMFWELSGDNGQSDLVTALYNTLNAP